MPATQKSTTDIGIRYNRVKWLYISAIRGKILVFDSGFKCVRYERTEPDLT